MYTLDFKDMQLAISFVFYLVAQCPVMSDH